MQKNAFCPTNHCLTAHFCNHFSSCNTFDKETVVSRLSVSWPVSLWQASSHGAISHSRAHPLITDPGAERVSFKLPQDTADAIKYDAQVEKWDVLWQPSDESCLPFVPFSIYSVAAFAILSRQGPCMHISAYPYIPFFSFLCVAVGGVSQAFSVRNEPGGTNRLAKYENWVTINGHVLLSAGDNDCVCT